MSYTLDDCFRALDAVGSKPQWRKNGKEIRAVCPAHPATSDDGLQITLFNDGGLRPKCYSGCARDAVLEAIGLQKQSGTRPNPQRRPPKDDPPPEPRPLPSGAPWWKPWIYTDAEGTPVLAVVRKDLGKNLDTGKMKKTFLQFTPAPDAPGRWLPVGMKGLQPLYHLRAVLDAPPDNRVTIVEGEKCVGASEKAWPDQIATTFAGGSSAWRKTDYEPLRGREVALISDADTPSRTAMRQLAYYLDTEMDCTVKVGLPEGETAEDMADWLEQDDAATVLSRVNDLLHDYESDEDDRTEPPADPKPPLEGDIVANPHYRLLGLSGDQVAFWISAGRVLLQSRESLCQPNTLVSLARLKFWYRVSDESTFCTSTARQIGDSLLARADELGQVDLTRVTGRGAFRLDDDTIGYHLGDRLLYGGEIVPLASDYNRNGASPRPKALDLRYFIAEPRIELGNEASDLQMRDAAKALMDYRWGSKDDGRRMLGWIVAATVGGPSNGGRISCLRPRRRPARHGSSEM